MTEISYVDPPPEILNKVCLVVPTHSPRLPFFYELIESYLAHRIFEHADLMVVLSNTEEEIIFKRNLGQVFEACPQLSIEILPASIFEEAKGKTVPWAVIKKFIGIQRAFAKNENYDYVLSFDDECEFFCTPDLYAEVDRYWHNAKFYSTKSNNECIAGIIQANKNMVYAEDKNLLPADNDYFWFNDIPVYERSTYHEFLLYFDLERNYTNLSMQVFEHLLYAYFLIIHGHFKLIDFTETDQVPEDLTAGSFLEELAIVDRNYIKLLEKIDPMWLPFQCADLKNWLAPRAFMTFHKDRVFTKAGEPPEKIALPLPKGPPPEVEVIENNGLFREFAQDIPYKYNEKDLLEELQSYVDATYSEHYAQGKIQTTEFIIDMGDGIPFTRGNVIKYAQRYGKKGGRNRKDILKILHYALIMLYVHDTETKELYNAD
jgi:hypothetical protein